MPIDDRFTSIDGRLETVDARTENFANHFDFDVEERHKLGENLAEMEKQV